jgi:hypothetical protein
MFDSVLSAAWGGAPTFGATRTRAPHWVELHAITRTLTRALTWGDASQ